MVNIYTRNNQPQPEMDYSTLNESRQGLKSMKLFNIIKQHGGFNEKTPSFYLHDMTDDDVIGVLPENDLQKLMKMNISDRNNYAIQHGFKINRGDRMEIIPLKDWTWIGVIERGGNLGNKEYLNSEIGKKINDRYKNRLNRGDKNYQWSDTGKWGSPRAEEFYMRRTQNDIANQRRQRYGNDAVYQLSEHVLSGLDEITKTTKDNENNNKINENNMSKIVLKEEELMTLVNESVKRVINEAIQNGELDENRVRNFIRSVFGGAQDAVGDDLDNAKDAVKGAWENTKDAAGRAWQNTKKAVGDVGKGIQKRATVFKNSYNANQAYLKIMDIRKDIDDILNSGLITGEQSVAALKNAKRCLQNLAASRKGVNSQKNKRIMNSNEEE